MFSSTMIQEVDNDRLYFWADRQWRDGFSVVVGTENSDEDFGRE